MPSMKRVKDPKDLPKTPKMLRGTKEGAKPKPFDKSVKTGGSARGASPSPPRKTSGAKPMKGGGMKSEYRKKGKRQKD
jgi:hypothetical protein